MAHIFSLDVRPWTFFSAGAGEVMERPPIKEQPPPRDWFTPVWVVPMALLALVLSYAFLH